MQSTDAPNTTEDNAVSSGRAFGLKGDVTFPMTAAGMKAWDDAMKRGERSWPIVLSRVYCAMKEAENART